MSTQSAMYTSGFHAAETLPLGLGNIQSVLQDRPKNWGLSTAVSKENRPFNLSQTIRAHWVILGCVMFIGFVSLVDIYWSFKTQEVLVHTELNPIGVFLIHMDGGDVALFMTCKTLGTMIVILTIPAVYLHRKDWGFVCGGCVATFQLCLFLFLNFGHLLGY